ncbi:MAG: phage tail tape measure protein, partial [Clostridia bacterium]|nr:phage tail tape measure protein [Clostridia bacterium]
MSNQLRVAGLRLVIEGAGEFQSALDRTEQEIKENRAQLKLLDAQYGKTDKSSEKLGKQQKLLGQQMEQQRAKLETMKAAYQQYTQQEKMSQKSADALRVAIMKQEAAVAGLQRQLRDTRWDKFAQGAVDAGKKLNQAGTKLTRGTMVTVGAGFAYSAKEAIEFEDAFAQVMKTVDGSEEELERLKAGAMALSASGAITQSKEEVAEIMGVAGQLAISTDHIMGFSKAMLQMGDATNLGAEDAATQLAQFANITQMSQDKFENLGSAIVALGNNTATQEDAIVSMGMRIAAAGSQADMSVASIMGISAALASVGVEAEAGGTAISKVLLNMDTAAAKGEKALKGYAEVAGMSSKEFKKLWDTSSEQAFTAFIQGLSRIDQEGGNVASTLEKLGYKEVRTRDALMRAAMAGDLLGDSISLANAAYQENTALAEEAGKKNSTFAARLKVLKNQADNAAMGLGEAMMPTLESAMGTVSSLVQQFAALDEEQKQSILTMGGIALAAGPVTSALGTMTQGVGYAVKGFKLLKTFLTGPGGWMGLAAVGLTGICAALAAIESPLDRVEKRLENVEFSVDKDLAATINAGIQRGIDGAQKEWSVQVTVKTQMDELGEGLDSALSDGKLSRKENKSLKKQLDSLIKADIDEAQKELDASVQAYLQTLSGLKTATGED